MLVLRGDTPDRKQLPQTHNLWWCQLEYLCRVPKPKLQQL